MELHPFLEADQRPTPRWWYVLSATGDSPSMRVGHSATFVPGQSAGEHDRVIIVGGANPSQIFDEVWTLDLKTRTWDTLECPGFRGRYEHAAFQVNNRPGKLFIFGGATQAGCLNDVQCMDTGTGVWMDVEVSGTATAPRTHRSSAVVGSKVYFFSGGHCGSEPVADRSVHCLDTESWTWTGLSPRGNAPKPRHGHLMLSSASSTFDSVDSRVRIQNNSSSENAKQGSEKDKGTTTQADSARNSNNCRIYMHGGMSGSTFFDDLHVLDVDQCAWSVVRKKRTSPSSRAAHDGVMHQNQMIIFGGMNQEGALEDAHRFNPEGNSWSKLEYEGPAPPNRLDFAMCTIKLSVPVASEASAQDALSELQGASASTKETLERELKPGSASSRGSFSDSASGDEAVFPLETGDSNQNQGHQPLHNHTEGDTTQAAMEQPDATTEDIHLIFIHGGMDTEGEIFDDTLVLAL